MSPATAEVLLTAEVCFNLKKKKSRVTIVSEDSYKYLLFSSTIGSQEGKRACEKVSTRILVEMVQHRGRRRGNMASIILNPFTHAGQR